MDPPATPSNDERGVTLCVPHCRFGRRTASKSPVGHWSPVIPVKLGPSLPGGDTLERIFEELLLRLTGYLKHFDHTSSETLDLVIADEAKYVGV